MNIKTIIAILAIGAIIGGAVIVKVNKADYDDTFDKQFRSVPVQHSAYGSKGF